MLKLFIANSIITIIVKEVVINLIIKEFIVDLITIIKGFIITVRFTKGSI